LRKKTPSEAEKKKQKKGVSSKSLSQKTSSTFFPFFLSLFLRPVAYPLSLDFFFLHFFFFSFPPPPPPTDRPNTMLSIHRTPSDPRKGRAKRVIAILALAAAAGAARAQTTTAPTTSSVGQAIAAGLAGIVGPPLETLGTQVDVALDEAQLLPCTVADVAGEFARLAQSGVLQMQALPCEAWVKLTIADGYGDDQGLAAKAGAGAQTIAFSLTPEEAEALRNSGVASGKVVSLNNLVSEVAVGARTPGFGGSLNRLLRRTADNFGAARDEVLSSWTGSSNLKAQAGSEKAKAELLDGGRAFPAQAQYSPLAFVPGAVETKVENLAPNGAIAILTAAEPGNGPVPANKGGVPANPVSVDTTNGGKGGAGGTGGIGGDGGGWVLDVSGSERLSAAAAETPAVRAPVGGSDPSLPAVVVGSAAAVQGLVAEQPLLIGR